MNARRAVAAAALVLAGALSGCSTAPTGVSGPSSPAAASTQVGPLGGAPPTVPTTRARPQYLDRSYREPVVPAGSPRRAAGRAGTLRIPTLRVVTPVDAVGLDQGVMAIPDDPARTGWLRSTAAVADRIGASVLSGHVSDRHDVPGPLARLRSIRRGAVITWTGVRGDLHRFVVTRIARYPRAHGVPARLFGVLGPHVLHLVTCSDRVRTAGGGFHYTSNLVVTAREVRGGR